MIAARALSKPDITSTARVGKRHGEGKVCRAVCDRGWEVGGISLTSDDFSVGGICPRAACTGNASRARLSHKHRQNSPITEIVACCVRTLHNEDGLAGGEQAEEEPLHHHEYEGVLDHEKHQILHSTAFTSVPSTARERIFIEDAQRQTSKNTIRVTHGGDAKEAEHTALPIYVKIPLPRVMHGADASDEPAEKGIISHCEATHWLDVQLTETVSTPPRHDTMVKVLGVRSSTHVESGAAENRVMFPAQFASPNSTRRGEVTGRPGGSVGVSASQRTTSR